MTPPGFTGPGSIARTVERIQWAESIGYDDVWLPDAGGIHALTLSALVFGATQRNPVRIAGVPAYPPPPPPAGSHLAALADLAARPFALGLRPHAAGRDP